MKDLQGRKINYLRISVTDLCNLRCKYCMPHSGVEKFPHENILTVEEIIKVTEEFTKLGIDKVRLTGGEPLVRNGILDIVKGIGKLDKIKDFAMTTNGIYLYENAEKLKNLGLDRVNISLDTLDSEKYFKITRGGDIKKVFKGIKKALDVGLKPIKLNVVLLKGFNDDEIDDFINLTKEEEIEVRFIELMPIGEGINFKDNYINNEEIIKLNKDLIKIESQDKSSPAEYYKLKGAKGKIGFINPLSCSFCDNCNRLRLTADGKIKNCLHGKEEYDIRKYINNGLNERIIEIVNKKPERHLLNQGIYTNKEMNKIGG